MLEENESILKKERDSLSIREKGNFNKFEK